MFIRPSLIPSGMEGAGDGARFKIRDPMTRHHLADTGEHKPESEYWLRRLNDRGVEIVEPPAASEQETEQ